MKRIEEKVLSLWSDTISRPYSVFGPMTQSGNTTPVIVFHKRFMVGAILTVVVITLLTGCGRDPVSPPPPTPVPEVGSLGGGSPTITQEADADDRAETEPRAGQVGSVAQEIKGISGWINSEPFSIASLQGKVVLVDFWTYTCVNCIRTIPFLKEWYEKYSDEGLVIVGVHTPEFEFEHVRENVEAAVEEFQIKWPVLQDNEMRTWQAFNNMFWPAKYLIDKDGVIQYTHFGEGKYVETELEIRKLLNETGARIDGIVANSDSGPALNDQASSGELETSQTREIYAGLGRNMNSQVPYIIQVEFYSNPQSTPILLEDPGDHQNHFLYLQGIWINGLESIQHARVTEDLEDYAALKYFGNSVNVVLQNKGEPYRVYLTVDEGPIPVTDRGADIKVGKDGRTFIFVDQDRMYRLIESPVYGGHEMKLSSNSNEFVIYAFTFGSYSTGP
ncbi:MAG: redoxin domain-containing protein [Chloroflexota bacterium]|nr:redoxin domain-containing protein [Chloroflexota bacterium]